MPSGARHRTTIRELAEYTGLSPAAVSYALRGMQVSAETERRVREAAEELGYEADPIARALAGGATAVVGLLVGSLADFWNQELVRAVQRELYGAARSTLVADADGEPGRELELAQRLVDHRVDGLVVVPIGPASGGWASIARQVATVTIGDALPGVAPGRRGGLRQRARRAAEPPAPERARPPPHHRALVGGRDVARPRGRARGRRARPPRSGSTASVVACAYSLNGSRPLALELLGSDDRPTAVLCLSDSIAYGVYAACAELGLSIPGDVAVAGFGDHPISRLLAPPLTSTAWDVDRVAELAHRLPARGDRRRRPAGDAARGHRAGARGARVDRAAQLVTSSRTCPLSAPVTSIRSCWRGSAPPSTMISSSPSTTVALIWSPRTPRPSLTLRSNGP